MMHGSGQVFPVSKSRKSRQSIAIRDMKILPEDARACSDVQNGSTAVLHRPLDSELVLPISPAIVKHQEMPALHQPVSHLVEVLLSFREIRLQFQGFVEMCRSLVPETHPETNKPYLLVLSLQKDATDKLHT